LKDRVLQEPNNKGIKTMGCPHFSHGRCRFENCNIEPGQNTIDYFCLSSDNWQNCGYPRAVRKNLGSHTTGSGDTNDPVVGGCIIAVVIAIIIIIIAMINC